MTERARIREEYKKKKRLPGPEPTKHFNKKKIAKFYIEQKLTQEGYKKELAWYNATPKSWFRKMPDFEWHKCHGKYARYQDAERALVALQKYNAESNRFWHDIIGMYEYRIVEIK